MSVEGINVRLTVNASFTFTRALHEDHVFVDITAEDALAKIIMEMIRDNGIGHYIDAWSIDAITHQDGRTFLKALRPAPIKPRY